MNENEIEKLRDLIDDFEEIMGYSLYSFVKKVCSDDINVKISKRHLYHENEKNIRCLYIDENIGIILIKPDEILYKIGDNILNIISKKNNKIIYSKYFYNYPEVNNIVEKLHQLGVKETL